MELGHNELHCEVCAERIAAHDEVVKFVGIAIRFVIIATPIVIGFASLINAIIVARGN